METQSWDAVGAKLQRTQRRFCLSSVHDHDISLPRLIGQEVLRYAAAETITAVSTSLSLHHKIHHNGNQHNNMRVQFQYITSHKPGSNKTGRESGGELSH